MYQTQAYTHSAYGKIILKLQLVWKIPGMCALTFLFGFKSFEWFVAFSLVFCQILMQLFGKYGDLRGKRNTALPISQDYGLHAEEAASSKNGFSESTGKDGDMGRNTSLPHATKRRMRTNVKTKQNKKQLILYVYTTLVVFLHFPFLIFFCFCFSCSFYTLKQHFQLSHYLCMYRTFFFEYIKTFRKYF